MGGICPLFFDGAICQFEELPRVENKTELQKVYNYIDKINNTKTSNSFFSWVKKRLNK